MRIHAVSRWTVLLLAVLSFGAAARDVPLVEAVKAGSAESVRALLDQRADVNVAEADGTTALHWAVQGEAAALVGLLIDAGAGVGAANRYGATPLSVACLTGNAGIIAQLLEAGADANAATAGGRTALMTAARTGHVAAVEVLLAHGADVHATDDTHGQTALMWAAAENNAEVVDTLARAGADVGARTRHGFTALLFAARAGRIEAAKALLAAGAEVDDALSNGVTPLLLAITNKNLELAAVLLRAGADPNRDVVGWSPLHQLAWSRQPPVGYDNPEPVHRDDVHALDLARQMMALGADPNARIAKELRDQPRQRSTGGTGATPFFLAARAGDADLMRVLAEYGADPFLPTDDNTTPLMAAAGVGVYLGADHGTNEEALEAFTFVLELGGNVHTVNAKGETALHGAATLGANPIVQLLAERGACLDATNDAGHTPLAIAEGVPQLVFRQQPETAALLRRLLESRTAQSTNTAAPPRMPWGDPDLQGVWDFSTITPLERPDDLAGREFWTEEEAANLEQQAVDRIERDAQPSVVRTEPLPITGSVGAYNLFWFGPGTEVVESRRTSLIIDPPDGKIPWTPEGEERRDARAAVQERLAHGPEDRTIAERCILGFNSGPPIVPLGYNQNVQLFQTPDYVVILNEMVHDARIVPLDGRPHIGDDIRQWKGDSRARWEGDTLVVDTANFYLETWMRGSSPNMHLVERFRRVDADTLLYEFTVEDPTTWTSPWTAQVSMRKIEDPIFEYACHEGNLGLLNILVVARAEEQAAAEATDPGAR